MQANACTGMGSNVPTDSTICGRLLWQVASIRLVWAIYTLLTLLQDLRASIATSNLQKATGKSAANQLFVLQNATLVEREAICGNLVCEAGERSVGTGEGKSSRIWCCGI